MSFVELRFLIFFPAVVALYLAIPERIRWAFLLVASYTFYMAWKPEYGLLLFIITTIDFFAGRLMGAEESQQKRKFYLIASLTANLGILFFFKYFNFVFSSIQSAVTFSGGDVTFPVLNILLPIGISFHIFQSMSYTIDVYRRRTKSVNHFGKFALYVSFFPQLVAGPIERPQGLLKQIMEGRRFNLEKAKSGARLMLWGYFKKLIIADNLAPFVTAAYAAPTAFPGPTLAFATVLFAYQIYCDFSGYTDIARGAARFFGYDLMLNFNRPFKATSVADFWRRWHISLSTWLRDYLYHPLAFSGKHITKPRIYMSIFITFVLIGLWHGANWTYVLFGTIHGIYLVIESVTKRWRITFGKKLGKMLKTHIYTPFFLRRILVFALVCFSYIFFRAATTEDAVYIATHLVANTDSFITALGSSSGRLYVLAMDIGWRGILIGGLGILVLEIVEYLHAYKSLVARFDRLPKLARATVYATIMCTVLLFGALGASEQFIYFQF
jgi:alginate O-acetyltransferase complex protein AlgI